MRFSSIANTPMTSRTRWSHWEAPPVQSSSSATILYRSVCITAMPICFTRVGPSRLARRGQSPAIRSRASEHQRCGQTGGASWHLLFENHNGRDARRVARY
jgi:hypothetical protein